MVVAYRDPECVREATPRARWRFAPSGFSSENNEEAIQAWLKGSLALNPEEEKDLVLTCQFKETDDGEFQVRVKTIYRKITENGNPVLKTIAKNVVWKAGPDPDPSLDGGRPGFVIPN